MTEEEGKAVEVHDIVQINPDDDRFGACLLVVTELKSWGVQGYVRGPGQAVDYYYRVKWADIELTGGKVAFAHPEDVNVDEETRPSDG